MQMPLAPASPVTSRAEDPPPQDSGPYARSVPGDSRANALSNLGYTARQAAFLALVALHGGYFLRRQYVAFRGGVDGARVTDLLRRVVARQHATRAAYCRATKVYHLCARVLYHTLGLDDSRNRRPARPAGITFKLMTLDVVLRHREATFLATEAEKVAYFTTTCRLSRTVLPASCYRASKAGGRATTRYFVDRAPISLTPPDGTVSVVYVQCWSRTLQDFEGFLMRYRPLLSALPHARVGFVATDPRLIADATAQWPRLWSRSRPAKPRLDVSASELEAHFRGRQRIDRKEWAGFQPRDLDRLRDELARFSSPEIAALYRRWCVLGTAALRDLDRPDTDTSLAPPPLDTEWLPFQYPLFPAAGGPL